MTALMQRIVDFPTRVFGLSNSAADQTLLVVDPAKCSPAVRAALTDLIGRGAMRITVSQ